MDASSDDDDDNDDEYEAESEEGKDSEMRVVFDTIEEAENTLAGTPFDLFASTTVIKSGLLHSSSDPTIRPLKDCLARIRHFHLKSVKGKSFGQNPAVRSLNMRLRKLCQAYCSTSIVNIGMPEFEELLALRICSPRGDGVAQISASLAELGYLHYGPRALFQPQQPPQPTPTEAIVTTQASAAEDESNEDFARRRGKMTPPPASRRPSTTLDEIKGELGQPRKTCTATNNNYAAILGWKEEVNEKLRKLEAMVARLGEQTAAVAAAATTAQETIRVAPETTTARKSPTPTPPPPARRTRAPHPPQALAAKTAGQKRRRPDSPPRENSSRKTAPSTTHSVSPMAGRDIQTRARTLARSQQQQKQQQQQQQRGREQRGREQRGRPSIQDYLNSLEPVAKKKT
ncbi:hypothetical protein VTH82DRAFT_3808 [Thermothelomyces myriococcoides]